VVRVYFGGIAQRVPVPKWGEGAANLGFIYYPTYSVEVLGIRRRVTLVVVYVGLYRTRIGLSPAELGRC
jgi:branched-chain amino acid transport system permease protein